jgi:general stress protein CsbA
MITTDVLKILVILFLDVFTSKNLAMTRTHVLLILVIQRKVVSTNSEIAMITTFVLVIGVIQRVAKLNTNGENAMTEILVPLINATLKKDVNTFQLISRN